MLVRVDYTKSEGLTQFDDNVNRSARNLEYQDWGEFLVVWRRGCVELYKDYVRSMRPYLFLLTGTCRVFPSGNWLQDTSN